MITYQTNLETPSVVLSLQRRQSRW